MAKTGKNKLRRWEYPAGSGIRVREIINRFAGTDHGFSYRVTIPARIAGVRQFKQFTDVEKAEAWAREQHDGAKKDGRKHFTLSPIQREDAVNALALSSTQGAPVIPAMWTAKRIPRRCFPRTPRKDQFDHLEYPMRRSFKDSFSTKWVRARPGILRCSIPTQPANGINGGFP